MGFRSNLQIPPANPPTAAQIAAAITASQGVFTPAPSTVSLTGTTQVSLSGQIGAAVPQPSAIATAAYLAGQRIVDTPAIIGADTQPLSAYSSTATVNNGGIGYPATGQGPGGTNTYDVRAYHGFQMTLGLTGATRGIDFCMVRISWYNDPNNLSPYNLLHQEVYEITNGLTYGQGQVFVCDRNHGPYMTIQFLGTNPSGNGTLAWTFEGTNREQDRFRITERLDYHPSNPAGNDGILLQTRQVCNAGQSTFLGNAGIYSGEVSIYAYSAQPFDIAIAAGSAGAINFAQFGSMADPSGSGLFLAYSYAVLPRRPTKWYATPVINNASATVALSVISSEF